MVDEASQRLKELYSKAQKTKLDWALAKLSQIPFITNLGGDYDVPMVTGEFVAVPTSNIARNFSIGEYLEAAGLKFIDDFDKKPIGDMEIVQVKASGIEKLMAVGFSNPELDLLRGKQHAAGIRRTS